MSPDHLFPWPVSFTHSSQLEEVFHLAAKFEGEVSHVLVQEDVGNEFDVRAWMARPPVVGRDGAPVALDGNGVFSRLKPNSQYRLESTGTRKKVDVPSDAPEAGGLSSMNVKMLDCDEDVSSKAMSCGCQVGKPCESCSAFQRAG